MTDDIAEIEPLDCGHVPAPFSAPPGYATAPSGQRLCYACSDNSIRDSMSSGNAFVAYADDGLRRITSWSGGTLASVEYVGKPNPKTGRSYVRARDLSGRLWYGQAAPGQRVTLRRLYG